MDKAREIIRKLLQETTFPAYDPSTSASRKSGTTPPPDEHHQPDCPWLLAVTEAEGFLKESES